MVSADTAGMTKTPRIVPTLASLVGVGIICTLVVGLAISLSGCGDNAVVGTPDAPDRPPIPTTSVYALHSELDLASNLPGQVGHAIGELIAATDDPDDPTRYIVDHIIAHMRDGTLRDLALAAEPFVTAYVNDRLLATSPQLLRRVVAVGNGLGDAARHFGTLDTLSIAPDGSATHAIVGVRVVLDGQVVELAFADHGIPASATGVAVHASRGRLALDRHALRLSLGRILRLVVDGAIVPHVDPGAVDLIGLLEGGVDCVAFGDAMHDALGFGSPSGFSAACRAALSDVATAIYGELDAVDLDTLELDLAGNARAVDGDGDGRIDELADGAWAGSVFYAGAPAPLLAGSFSGVRVE